MIASKRIALVQKFIGLLNDCTDGVWSITIDGLRGNNDFMSVKTTYTYGLNGDKSLDFTIMVGKIHYSPVGNEFIDLLFAYDYGVDAALVVEETEVSPEYIYHMINDFLEYYTA